MNWISIKEKKPPYDEAVVVYGEEDKDFKYYDGWTKELIEKSVKVRKYAIAFNNNYPPHMWMVQIVETPDCENQQMDIPFTITHWAKLD